MKGLLDSQTRLLVQGITGRDGGFHASQMKAYGTKVVAGVTPGKGGSKVHGIAVYDTVAEAAARKKANASVVFVPAMAAADAAWEALDAGMSLVVVITEGVPVSDMVELSAEADRRGARLIGPNCPGLIVPGVAKVGIIPGFICKKGPVGVVSRSGTLTYEIVNGLTRQGLGQSACIGIGGDPIVGMRFVDTLRLFQDDPRTKAIVMVGEIGGEEEEEAALFCKKNVTKPVISFIAGKTAPKGKRMGHAGAIISGSSGTAEGKIKALKRAGIAVGTTPDEVVSAVVRRLKGSKHAGRRRHR